MKFILGLSSCALVALSISPCLAANRAIGSSTVRPLSHQSSPTGTKTIQVAESLDQSDFMFEKIKSVKGLSNIALVSLFNASPRLALSQLPNQLSSNRSRLILQGQDSANELISLNNPPTGESKTVGAMLISDRVQDRAQRQQEQNQRQQESNARREQNRQDQLQRQQESNARREQSRQDTIKRQQDANARREQYRQDTIKRHENAAARTEQIRQDTIKRQQDANARREQNRLDRIEREKQAAIERQEIRAQMQKRQEQMELARKEASEAQRQEADRRLKYYESLSPEEKKAYRAKQEAIQKQQNEMAAKLFGAVIQSALSPRVCESGSWLTGYTYYEC